MRPFFYLFIALHFILNSCSPAPEEEKSFQIVKSRDGIATYLCKPPKSWTQLPEIEGNQLNDSTLPIASWVITEGLDLVVHNFPGSAIQPQAQIARWEGQIPNQDSSLTSVEPVAWGGFEGLRLFISDQSGKSILGFAMTLPQLHRYQLQGQKREDHLAADWTIKVTGDAALLLEHEESIDQFAQSFRLKSEIPS